MAKHPKFDEVVDFVLAKVPPEHQDRESIAESVEVMTDLADMLLPQLQGAGAQIGQLTKGVTVPADEAKAIRAKYDEYGVSLGKVAALLGVNDEEAVVKLSYLTPRHDPSETYEKQAMKMYILGSLCDGFDVLKS